MLTSCLKNNKQNESFGFVVDHMSIDEETQNNLLPQKKSLSFASSSSSTTTTNNSSFSGNSVEDGSNIHESSVQLKNIPKLRKRLLSDDVDAVESPETEFRFRTSSRQLSSKLSLSRSLSNSKSGESNHNSECGSPQKDFHW